jgi:hypothetical protein
MDLTAYLNKEKELLFLLGINPVPQSLLNIHTAFNSPEILDKVPGPTYLTHNRNQALKIFLPIKIHSL